MMKDQDGVISQQQVPALDGDQLYRAEILNKIKPGLHLAFANGEIRINVDNVMPIIKIMEIHTHDESILDLIREALIETRGEIDAGEFEKAVVKKVMSTEEDTMECIKAAFALADYDADGHITGADIYRLMMGLGEMVTDTEIMTMLRAADLDGDGRISLTDFTTFMMNTTPQPAGIEHDQHRDGKATEATGNKPADGQEEGKNPERASSRQASLNLQPQDHHAKRRTLFSYVGSKVKDAVEVVSMFKEGIGKTTQENSSLQNEQDLCQETVENVDSSKVNNSNNELRKTSIDKSSVESTSSQIPDQQSCPTTCIKQDKHVQFCNMEDNPNNESSNILKKSIEGIAEECPFSYPKDQDPCTETDLKSEENMDSWNVEVNSETYKLNNISDSDNTTTKMPETPSDSEKVSRVADNSLTKDEFVLIPNGLSTKRKASSSPNGKPELPIDCANHSNEPTEIFDEIATKRKDSIGPNDTPELPSGYVRKRKASIFHQSKPELLDVTSMKRKDSTDGHNQTELLDVTSMKLKDSIDAHNQTELLDEIATKRQDSISPCDQSELLDEIATKQDSFSTRDQSELLDEIATKQDSISTCDQSELLDEIATKQQDSIFLCDQSELLDEIAEKQQDNIFPRDQSELLDEIATKQDIISPSDQSELLDEIAEKRQDIIFPSDQSEVPYGYVKKRKTSIFHHSNSELADETATKWKDSSACHDKLELLDNVATNPRDSISPNDESELIKEMATEQKHSIVPHDKCELAGDVAKKQKDTIAPNDQPQMPEGFVKNQKGSLFHHDQYKLPDQITGKRKDRIVSHDDFKLSDDIVTKQNDSVSSNGDPKDYNEQTVVFDDLVTKRKTSIDLESEPESSGSAKGSNKPTEVFDEIARKRTGSIATHSKYQMAGYVKRKSSTGSHNESELPEHVKHSNEVFNENATKRNISIAPHCKTEIKDTPTPVLDGIATKSKDCIAPHCKTEIKDTPTPVFDGIATKSKDCIAPHCKPEIKNTPTPVLDGIATKSKDCIAPYCKPEIKNTPTPVLDGIATKSKDCIDPHCKPEIKNTPKPVLDGIATKSKDCIDPHCKPEIKNTPTPVLDGIATKSKDCIDPHCKPEIKNTPTPVLDGIATKSKDCIDPHCKPEIKNTPTPVLDGIATKSKDCIAPHCKPEIKNTPTPVLDGIATKSKDCIDPHCKPEIKNTPTPVLDGIATKSKDCIDPHCKPEIKDAPTPVFDNIATKSKDCIVHPKKPEQPDKAVQISDEATMKQNTSIASHNKFELTDVTEHGKEQIEVVEELIQPMYISRYIVRPVKTFNKLTENRQSVSVDSGMIQVSGNQIVQQLSLTRFQTHRNVPVDTHVESDHSIQSDVVVHRVSDNTKEQQNERVNNIKPRNDTHNTLCNNTKICNGKDQSPDGISQLKERGSSKSPDKMLHSKGVGSSESLDASLQPKGFGSGEKHQDGGTIEETPDASTSDNATCSNSGSGSQSMVSVMDQGQQTMESSFNNTSATNVKDSLHKTINIVTIPTEGQLKKAKILERAIVQRMNTVGNLLGNIDADVTSVSQNLKELVNETSLKPGTRPKSSYIGRKASSHQTDQSLCKVTIVDVTASIEKEQVYEPDKVAARKHHGFNSIRPLARVIMAFNKTKNATNMPQFTSLSRQLEESKLVLSWDSNPVSEHTKRQGVSSAPASGKTKQIISDDHLSTDPKYSPIHSRRKESQLSGSLLALSNGNEDGRADTNLTPRPKSSPTPSRRNIYSDPTKQTSRQWDKIKNAFSNKTILSGRNVSKSTSALESLNDIDTSRDNLFASSKRTPILTRRNAFPPRNDLTPTLTCSPVFGRGYVHTIPTSHGEDTERSTIQLVGLANEMKHSRVSSAVSTKRTSHDPLSDVTANSDVTAKPSNDVTARPHGDVTARPHSDVTARLTAGLPTATGRITSAVTHARNDQRPTTAHASPTQVRRIKKICRAPSQQLLNLSFPVEKEYKPQFVRTSSLTRIPIF